MINTNNLNQIQNKSAYEANNSHVKTNNSNTEIKKEVNSIKDQIVLTRNAQELQKLNDKIRKSPIVDKDKVELLRNKMQNGTYQINPEKTAKSLYEFEKLFDA